MHCYQFMSKRYSSHPKLAFIGQCSLKQYLSFATLIYSVKVENQYQDKNILESKAVS